MKNLKIRVNSESESKEVQELFFELGYSWNGNKKIQELSYPVNGSYWLCTKNGMSLFNCIKWGTGHDSGKLITLPELRDLVVLKRNNREDANVSEENCLYDLYLTESKELYFYHCGKNKWILSNLNGDDDYYESLKPIEKPMKEYLRKNNDGEYILEVTNEREAQEPHAKHWIEIPEGAQVYAVNNGYHYFFSSAGIGFEWSVLWQRPSLPEELPFIDDEPLQSLNDQYAEIEKVRQSHRTASKIADSALKHIRERAETYDQPTGERSAAKTAKAFNAITGKDITESEVWLLLQLLKDVRQWSREDYHQDSAEDCIAYAALKAESLESEK